LALELVVVLPVLLLTLLAMAQFSMLLTARSELLEASREGARLAARGGDHGLIETEVKATVRRVLGKGRLAGTDVVVQWKAADPDHPEAGRERVEVQTSTLAAVAAPNFLGWLGFTLQGQRLTATTVMNVE
jgi:Flp pilus assembly protein TadG